MKNFNTSAIATLFLLSFTLPSLAQQELKVNFGEKISIPLNIKSEQECNIELTIGKEKTQKQTAPSNNDITIEYQGNEIGTIDIKWEGKFRARGLKSVQGCSGSGFIKVTTLPNADQIKQEWNKFLSALKQDQAECVRIALRHRNIQIDSIDPSANIDSTNSPVAKEIYAKCDSFLAAPRAWKNESQDDFACTMSSGLKTRCSGVYAERTSDGKLRSISKDIAIQYHLDGKQWTTGQREADQAKQTRERQVAEEKARKEAEEIAKREAEERERKWKESPEYKKQQAELEKKRVAEQKAKEENERKEREQAELAARQKKAEEDKRKRELEEREKKERMEFAQNFPFYAVITCGFQGQHMNIIPCFAGNVGTELELKNGSEYNLYQVQDLMTGRVGRETREGFIINLRRSFSLKAQNADENLILGVKIINRASNENVFEKKVSRFGLIRVSN